MLKKSKITASKMVDRGDWSYNKEWKLARLGKITSSKIHLICAPEGIGKVGMSYLMDLVGETLAQEPASEEIDTEATRHGLFYEYEAAQKFMQVMGWGLVPNEPPFVISQTLIAEKDSRFGSTPDLITVFSESTDQLEYRVSVTEIKNPLTYKAYVELALCESPQDVKKVSAAYYWQVISQIEEADCLKGYLVVYHPKMKQGNLTVIEFDMMQCIVIGGKNVYPLRLDRTLLRDRKAQAEQLFNSIREKLLAKGVF